MIQFNEKFGELMVQERKSKGWTRERLAEAMGIDYDRLSKWERGVYRYPLEMVTLALTILKSNLFINEAGQIEIGKGMMKMNPIYTKDFEQFDVALLLEEFKLEEQKTAQFLHQRAVDYYEKCRQAGWAFKDSMNQYPLDEHFPTANHLESGEQYQFYPENGENQDIPRLIATVCFVLSGEWLNLPRLIEDLKKSYGSDLAYVVEKSFVYGCFKESKGAELFNWVHYKKDADALIRRFPTLAPWAALVADQIQQSNYVEKYEGLFANYQWYSSLGLVDEYQDQEFMLSWELPDHEMVEVDEMDSLRTFDDLIGTALVIIEEDFEKINQTYQDSLVQ